MAAACSSHKRRRDSFKGGGTRVPRAGRRRLTEGREEARTGLSMAEKEAAGGGEEGNKDGEGGGGRREGRRRPVSVFHGAVFFRGCGEDIWTVTGTELSFSCCLGWLDSSRII
jgi:hypothetical protein